MVNVKNVFEGFKQLTPDELFYEVPTMVNAGTESVKGIDVPVFKVTHVDAVYCLLANVLQGRMNPDFSYSFPDGSKAKFIKCRNRYEFKQHGKLFAVIGWG